MWEGELVWMVWCVCVDKCMWGGGSKSRTVILSMYRLKSVLYIYKFLLLSCSRSSLED